MALLSYNGFDLPQIPVDYSSVYPYALMYRLTNDTDFGYYLALTSVRPYYDSTEKMIKLPEETIYAFYEIVNTETADSWGTGALTDSPSDKIMNAQIGKVNGLDVILFWSNADILQEDGKTIYLRGSSPVQISELYLVTKGRMEELADQAKRIGGSYIPLDVGEMVRVFSEAGIGDGNTEITKLDLAEEVRI